MRVGDLLDIGAICPRREEVEPMEPDYPTNKKRVPSGDHDG